MTTVSATELTLPGNGEVSRAGSGKSLFLHTSCRCLLIEAPDGEIIDHLLHFLHIILQAVIALPQGVVFQVEKAEPGIQLVDEGGDVKGPGVVSSSHTVDRQP